MSCNIPTELTNRYRQCVGPYDPNITIDQVINYWNTNDCVDAISTYINFDTQTCAIKYNKANQITTANNIKNNLFKLYFTRYNLTDNILSSQYNVFQETLHQLCINPSLPGVCGNFLEEYCNTFGNSPEKNRSIIESSPVRTNFCGCYTMPDPVYQKYVHGTQECLHGLPNCRSCVPDPNNLDLCPSQPSCDPLCARALTSRKANTNIGTLINCPQSVCVIDDVVINVTNSVVPGGVNFNNVCSGCNQGAGCLCVISGVSIPETLGNVGLGANYTQFCGPESVCLVNGSPVECTGDLNTIPINPFSTRPIYGLIIIILIIVIIAIILAIISYF